MSVFKLAGLSNICHNERMILNDLVWSICVTVVLTILAISSSLIFVSLLMSFR